MRARRVGLIKLLRLWRRRWFRQLTPRRDVPLICSRKQRRDLGESLFRKSILKLHRRLHVAVAAVRKTGCGREPADRALAQQAERMWLLERGSSTHNEFRLAARPLSGDQGVPAPY